MNTPIRFLHISDTHFGPTKDYEYHGKNPYQDALRLVSYINHLPCAPDFIVHTGDVVSMQNEAAYALASEVLKSIKIPLYYVTGNHDDPQQLQQFEPFGKRISLLDDDRILSYYFEFGNYLFITIDAKNPDDHNPSGIISAQQINVVTDLLKSTNKPFAVFTHFPAMPIDSPWIDAHLLITNGASLHQCLTAFSDRCLGVFFGHIHQPIHMMVDKILYTSAPSSSFQFAGWPTDTDTLRYNDTGLPGLNLVTIGDKGSVTVKKITISVS